MASPAPNAPCAITIDGKLYAYGGDLYAAWDNFRAQLAGADYATRRSMCLRAQTTMLTDDEASEVAECIAAPVLAWE